MTKTEKIEKLREVDFFNSFLNNIRDILINHLEKQNNEGINLEISKFDTNYNYYQKFVNENLSQEIIKNNLEDCLNFLEKTRIELDELENSIPLSLTINDILCYSFCEVNTTFIKALEVVCSE